MKAGSLQTTGGLPATSPAGGRRLNLGCGSRYHPDWTNVDTFASSPGVLEHDLRRGIPFPDGVFEVVYHSHVLEHFSRHEAPGFVAECYRVLKRGGVIRVAVPDLEAIARNYLANLERAAAGEPEGRIRYPWMMLELYDQVVRDTPGGGMLEYLRHLPPENEAFVMQRMGGEARRILSAIRNPKPKSSDSSARPGGGALSRLRQGIKRRLLRRLIGEVDFKLMPAARFRNSGEIHQWMYDRYSLGKLLEDAGFVSAAVVTASQSRIPDWAAFHLDTEPDGATYKPDSLFMEAAKD